MTFASGVRSYVVGWASVRGGGGRVWVVPARLEYDDIEEQVCAGGCCVLYNAVNQRHRVVGIGGLTVTYQSLSPHGMSVDDFLPKA